MTGTMEAHWENAAAHGQLGAGRHVGEVRITKYLQLLSYRLGGFRGLSGVNGPTCSRSNHCFGAG